MKKIFSMKQLALALAFLGLAACNASVSVDGTEGAQGDNQKPAYRAEAAAGLINSQGWVFLSGTAKPAYDDASRMSLSLYNQEFEDPCSGFSFGKANVLTSVPAAVGETVFGQMPNIETATFSYTAADGSGANLIATEGRLAITEITAETVSGFIIATYDGTNFVNGAFKLKVCARQFR